jgi:hypothetical protein
MLAAGASALAGFFIGGKLPQLKASGLDAKTIKKTAGTLIGVDAGIPGGDHSEYVAYTIPNCGKLPDQEIVGDPVAIPKPTITNSVSRIIKDAGSPDKKTAIEAGRLIADALGHPLQQEVVIRSEIKTMYIDIDDQVDTIHMGNQIVGVHTHYFSCDMRLKYMRDARVDIFSRMCMMLADDIAKTLNKYASWSNKYMLNTIDVVCDERMHDRGRFGLIVTVKTTV